MLPSMLAGYRDSFSTDLRSGFGTFTDVKSAPLDWPVRGLAILLFIMARGASRDHRRRRNYTYGPGYSHGRSRCGAEVGTDHQLWPALARKEMWQRVSFSTDLDCSKRRSSTSLSDNNEDEDEDEEKEENKIPEEEY
ncbi:hypothetical protein M0802_010042 [Mischocyttarus mexicanus]|nr:hypothetical protein M0802_010042 [Mischocyttarus mexicanus]